MKMTLKYCIPDGGADGGEWDARLAHRYPRIARADIGGDKLETLLVDVGHRDAGRRVAVEAVQIHGHVQVDDVGRQDDTPGHAAVRTASHKGRLRTCRGCRARQYC